MVDMDRLFWILVFVFIAGLFILLLPDNGVPVIKLNEEHGPSSIDLVGLSLMLGSWLISYILVFMRWQKVINKFGKSNTIALCFLYFILILGIVAGLMLSSEWILWPSAITAFLINIAFLIPVFRRN